MCRDLPDASYNVNKKEQNGDKVFTEHSCLLLSCLDLVLMEIWGSCEIRMAVWGACGTGCWVYQPIGLLVRYFIGKFTLSDEH